MKTESRNLEPDLPEKTFGLYLVLTNPVAGYELCTQAAVEYGVRYVQLRMKGAPYEDVLRQASRLKSITFGSSTRFIVNDDVSVAIASDADGVHLGQTDLGIEEARRRWGSAGKVYGLSTHSEEQAARASLCRPNYIGVGPIFPTPSKAHPDPLLGLVRAAAIVRASSVPCVGIGGIDEENLAGVLAAGIENFAVIRAVGESPHPGERIRSLMSMWRRDGRGQ